MYGCFIQMQASHLRFKHMLLIWKTVSGKERCQKLRIEQNRNKATSTYKNVFNKK